MAPILSWFHEDPDTLKKQLTHPEDAEVTDIIGVGPALYYQLSFHYDISTIGQLVDHIIIHGFPTNITFKEETKFVLSARAANKIIF